MRIRTVQPLRHLVLPLLAVACGGGDADESAAAQAPARTAAAPGAIAYVGDRGRTLRLIQPDGSAPRTVWQVPDTLYSITAPSWRPDGREIAFASDHEMAVSFYERDLYTISPDGSGLHRITNAPAHEGRAGRPTGTVTVAVQNITMDPGPYFIYVAGAPQPKQELVPALGTARFTFENVADLGPGVIQPIVVISGINRWWDAAAAPDVSAGRSVEAPPVTISANPIEHWGADWPMWNAAGDRLGYFLGPTCLLQEIRADGAVGAAAEPLLDAEVFGPLCAVDRSTRAGMTDPLLIVDMGDYSTSGETHVLRVAPAARSRPEPVVTFDRYVRVIDLRWLPDGSGFVVARQDDLVDEDVNLYEFTIATRQLRRITDLSGEHVRHFSISPSGDEIVFERVRGSISELATLPSDLWIVRRDGGAPRLLARNASYPSWSPR